MNKNIKDIIYIHISVSELALCFVDTFEFQRLRRIKQSSTSHLMFPSLNNTRFEHCLGVYHLTGVMLEHLNPEINPRMLEIIKIGGLMHDIGHMALSHTFDNYIIPKLDNYSKLKDHEYRSTILIKHMIEKYKIDITEQEYNIMCSVILGKYIEGMPKYLFQIVCNSENGIDVDKMDYLIRDSYYMNQHTTFDISYIIKSSKIINNTICFNQKAEIHIYKMLNLRFTLHKELFQHTITVSTELMFRDLILKNIEKLKLNKIHENFEWLKITDDLIYSLEDSIMDNIYSRKIYKMTYEKPQNEKYEKITRKFSFSNIPNFDSKILFYIHDKKTNSYDLVKTDNIFKNNKNTEIDEIYIIY